MDCLNCGKKLVHSDNYCSSCGQAASTARMKTHDVFHNVYHAFTHTDKGFFYLIPQLLVKPGIIAREYTQGKRKKYFNPFTFIILILAINTILVSSFNLMSLDLRQATNPVGDFLNKHFNIIIFIAIPLMAFITSLLFKKKGLNFAEGMVIGCYTSGERSIFHMVVITPLLIFFRDHYALIIAAYLALFALYYAWTCCQYFNDFKVWTFIKGLSSFVFCQVIISTLIGIAFAIYFSQSRS